MPAYLQHLLRERRHFDDLPFQLARHLTRPTDPDGQQKFARRIAPLSAAQREVIRGVLALLALLATVSPVEAAMARALTTWNDLSRSASPPT